MSNVHASFLEKILIGRGVEIKKVGRDWELSKGAGARVTYSPHTGKCRRSFGKPEELRGRPERVAEILEGYIA